MKSPSVILVTGKLRDIWNKRISFGLHFILLKSFVTVIWKGTKIVSACLVSSFIALLPYLLYFVQKRLLPLHRCGWNLSQGCSGFSATSIVLKREMVALWIFFLTAFVFLPLLQILITAILGKQGIIKCKACSTKSIYVIWSREAAKEDWIKMGSDSEDLG